MGLLEALKGMGVPPLVYDHLLELGVGGGLLGSWLFVGMKLARRRRQAR